MTEDIAAIYTAFILRGLRALHAKRIVHRDIQCANLLLGEKAGMVIGNFTSAFQFANDDFEAQEMQDIACAYFAAPEIAQRLQCSPASDIWSVGCAVIEMLDGVPYGSRDSEAEYTRKLQEGLAKPWIQCGTKISKELHHFLKLCLHPNPVSRPPARCLLNHPWVNFRTLEEWDEKDLYDAGYECSASQEEGEKQETTLEDLVMLHEEPDNGQTYNEQEDDDADMSDISSVTMTSFNQLRTRPSSESLLDGQSYAIASAEFEAPRYAITQDKSPTGPPIVHRQPETPQLIQGTSWAESILDTHESTKRPTSPMSIESLSDSGHYGEQEKINTMSKSYFASDAVKLSTGHKTVTAEPEVASLSRPSIDWEERDTAQGQSTHPLIPFFIQARFSSAHLSKLSYGKRRVRNPIALIVGSWTSYAVVKTHFQQHLIK
ncbi:hypothetical protein BZG36_00360 [Bifiguratus adelaidae]|uniref:Protein kinase domain-containing protein n=1 Tax=Bifiguratus adelaidae TaxID=1938954 RepID=A0A261Y7Z7_9FUNG|nr:hypothetical protein BZG36_00360 [Bifiguratus adelaidae]